jgi:hypothetical protein
MHSIFPNRITPGGAKRLGLAIAVVAALVAIAGCGGGSSSASSSAGPGTTTSEATSQDVSTPTTAAQQSPDGEVLDGILARQEGAVAAYSGVMAHLSPTHSHLAAYFRRQEQEHVDATLRALRGIQAPAETGPEEIDLGEPKTDEERLIFLYELESATVAKELDAIGRLEDPSARTLLASTAADQAQHLTLLRQALGAGPLAAVPSPFEDGTTPPPE